MFRNVLEFSEILWNTFELAASILKKMSKYSIASSSYILKCTKFRQNENLIF